MSEITDPLAWVDRAEEDYLLARSSLRRKAPLTYGACFHAQQCAEKYLKALLVARGQPFPKIHDLVALADLCAQAGLILAMDPDQLAALASYAVRIRYPGDLPTAEEARQAWRFAKTVRRIARGHLGLR